MRGGGAHVTETDVTRYCAQVHPPSHVSLQSDGAFVVTFASAEAANALRAALETSPPPVLGGDYVWCDAPATPPRAAGGGRQVYSPVTPQGATSPSHTPPSPAYSPTTPRGAVSSSHAPLSPAYSPTTPRGAAFSPTQAASPAYCPTSPPFIPGTPTGTGGGGPPQLGASPLAGSTVRSASLMCIPEWAHAAVAAPAAAPAQPLDVKLGNAVRLVHGHGKFSSMFITPMTVPAAPLCVLRVTLVGRLVLVRPGATRLEQAAEVQRLCVAAVAAAGGSVMQCKAIPGKAACAWVQLKTAWETSAVMEALRGVQGVRVSVSPYACVMGTHACVPEASARAAPPLLLPTGEYVVRARGIPAACTRGQLESALGGVAVTRLALMPAKKGGEHGQPQCVVAHIASSERGARRGSTAGMSGVIAAYQALHGRPHWLPPTVNSFGAPDKQGISFVTPLQGLREGGVKRPR